MEFQIISETNHSDSYHFYEVLMQSGILSIDNYKIKIATLKNPEDGLCPAEPNIWSRFYKIFFFFF